MYHKKSTTTEAADSSSNLVSSLVSDFRKQQDSSSNLVSSLVNNFKKQNRRVLFLRQRKLRLSLESFKKTSLVSVSGTARNKPNASAASDLSRARIIETTRTGETEAKPGHPLNREGGPRPCVVIGTP